jgi:ABC-2 type transport system ATP-binding protein
MSAVARPAIAVGGISKWYGPVRAVAGVSLEVAPGEIYALLGLNGAGKTTLIRMLLSMVRPTSGSVELLGRTSGSRAAWPRVGYLVETPSAYPELTVRENLEVMRRLRRLPSAQAVDDAIALFGLGPYAERRARTLSLGNLQRLGLAKAMLHRPSLVLLDEPVNGLDPAGVVEIRTLLSSLAREHGITVFLSSHILGEVARLATRVGVLHHGRLIDEFTAADLPRRVDRHLLVATRDDTRAATLLAACGMTASTTESGLRLTNDRAVQSPDVVATALVRGGCPPTRLTVVEEDLESYFLRLVGSASTDEPHEGMPHA